jgi:hypothetical protein
VGEAVSIADPLPVVRTRRLTVMKTPILRLLP